MPDLIDLVRQQVRQEHQEEQHKPAHHSPSPRPDEERTWLPDTPDFGPNGNTQGLVAGAASAPAQPGDAAEAIAAQAVAASGETLPVAGQLLPEGGAGYRAEQNCVNHTEVLVPQGSADTIRQILGGIGVNLAEVARGRKNVFDDFLRGRLVSLLAMGLSLRQSASALGVSHVAVLKELKRNPEVAEQINAARFQAQIEPLLVIVRESKRSWRAATWLVNYLTRQLQNREETPDEGVARVSEERREFNRNLAEQRAAEKQEERRLREDESIREFDAQFPTAARSRARREKRKAAAKRRAAAAGGETKPGP